MIEQLTPIQTKILTALGRYKFLTVSQMIKLEVATQKTHLSTHLLALKEKKYPYIGQMTFGFHPRIGRLESFYYLTPKAKQLLVDELKMNDTEIKVPIGTSTLFSQDYFHRKNTIDCEIAINQSAKQGQYEIIFFDRYFDKTGNNRNSGTSRAKTKIDIDSGHYLIADGIFMLQKPEHRELYCFEMYNGKDTARVLKQLKQHVLAIAAGSPSIKYGFDKGNRVISIFEFEGAMHSVIEKLQADPDFKNMKKNFLFKALLNIEKNNFFDGWVLM